MAQQKIFKPTNNSVDFLFHPKSFAILGLSQDMFSMPKSFCFPIQIQNLLGQIQGIKEIMIQTQEIG